MKTSLINIFALYGGVSYVAASSYMSALLPEANKIENID